MGGILSINERKRQWTSILQDSKESSNLSDYHLSGRILQPSVKGSTHIPETTFPKDPQKVRMWGTETMHTEPGIALQDSDAPHCASTKTIQLKPSSHAQLNVNICSSRTVSEGCWRERVVTQAALSHEIQCLKCTITVKKGRLGGYGKKQMNIF